MKKILIIGATSAIAQEIAKQYSIEKSELILVGRRQDFLDIIAQDLQVRGASKVSVFAQDLNDFSLHHQLIEKIWGLAKKVDVVLLAHGVLGNQDKAEADQGELLSILNSNFMSHASLLNEVAAKMKQQKSGTIAVISSVAGDRGKQSNYIYGAAQSAKSTYADGLRNRLFPYGVNVITFKLGFVDTPMTKEFKKGALWASPSGIAKGIVKSIEHGKNIVYLPFFWRYIMMIIKNIPEGIFKKLKM